MRGAKVVTTTLIMERFLEKSITDMLSLLKELVNQDSGSQYIIGVNKVGQIIRQQFEHLG